jgi:dTDP-glucose 4,6-dehydratase
MTARFLLRWTLDWANGQMSDSRVLRVLVTGGAGFIGSALVRHLVANTKHHVLNLDKLTYAGDLRSLGSAIDSTRYAFVEADVCDRGAMRAAFESFQPDVVVHLAAESHVDRSIDGPAAFVQTNIVGTFVLLSEALEYWGTLDSQARERFRFHHVSTDEVFGSLGAVGQFTETSPYSPRSPYSASKASADHLVQAWRHTYGLPVVMTNCSNNYGPFHFPEKFIPLMIIKGITGKPLPVYGDGLNVRDWLYVEDHARALNRVFEAGEPGETYVIGGRCERTNLEVVRQVCDCLDRIRPRGHGRSHHEQIAYVVDRPGHDRRYSIDPSKIERQLGWTALQTFETGIEATVRWYLENEWWWQPIMMGADAGHRLGLQADRPVESAH